MDAVGGSRLSRWMGHAALLAILAAYAFPIYWMLKSSLEPSDEAQFEPHLLPRGLSFHNYARLFEDSEFNVYLANSVTVAVGTTILSLTLATLAAYGLARFEFPGRTAISRSVLLVYMFPVLALAVPLFTLFSSIGLRNTRIGLVLAHTSVALPFCIWLLWQFFQTIPRSYSESAYSLGASKIRTFLQIELPLAAPGLVAAAIFTFALSWEDFTFAFTLTTDVSAKTLPVGISSFVTMDVIYWGLIQAAAVVMAVPALVIVLFFQRWMIRGLGSGGLKG